MIPDPRDIIIAPVISEKSYGLLEQGQYTFLVRPGSNKTEIKIAVEKIFGVDVASVNTINRPGKRKRTRTSARALQGCTAFLYLQLSALRTQ